MGFHLDRPTSLKTCPVRNFRSPAMSRFFKSPDKQIFSESRALTLNLLLKEVIGGDAL